MSIICEKENWNGIYEMVKKMGGSAYGIELFSNWEDTPNGQVEEPLKYEFEIYGDELSVSVYGIASEYEYSAGLSSNEYEILLGNLSVTDFEWTKPEDYNKETYTETGEL